MNKYPRWYYALNGHCEKNGCSMSRTSGGYKIECPDEVTKMDIISYAQTKCNKSPKDIDELSLFIADSSEAYAYVKHMVDPSVIEELYESGVYEYDTPEFLDISSESSVFQFEDALIQEFKKNGVDVDAMVDGDNVYVELLDRVVDSTDKDVEFAVSAENIYDLLTEGETTLTIPSGVPTDKFAADCVKYIQDVISDVNGKTIRIKYFVDVTNSNRLRLITV